MVQVTSIVSSIVRPIVRSVVGDGGGDTSNLLVNPRFLGAVSGTPGTEPTGWTRTVEGTVVTSVANETISADVTAGRFVLEQSVPLEVGTYIYEAYFEYLSGTAVLIVDLLWTNSSGTKTYFVDDVESLAAVTGTSKLHIRIEVASPHTAIFYLGVGVQGAATREYSITDPSLIKLPS